MKTERQKVVQMFFFFSLSLLGSRFYRDTPTHPQADSYMASWGVYIDYIRIDGLKEKKFS
jgi:hypothetical protein